MSLTNLIAGAVALAHSIRGVPMTIRRGTGLQQVTTAAPVLVTIGKTNVLQDVGGDDGEALIRSALRDHLVAVSDYVLGGEPVTPQLGDIFEDANGVRFEARPAGGEPEWRYTDQETRQFFRIHVIQVN